MLGVWISFKIFLVRMLGGYRRILVVEPTHKPFRKLEIGDYYELARTFEKNESLWRYINNVLDKIEGDVANLPSGPEHDRRRVELLAKISVYRKLLILPEVAAEKINELDRKGEAYKPVLSNTGNTEEN